MRQVVFVEKLCYSGSRAVRLATNHSVGYTQDGHTVSWCLFWSSVLEKSIEFSFHTLIKRWWIDIRHLFSAKRHSYKIKSKFSRWTNFPQHKLCFGEVRPHHLGKILPFCLPVAFYTSVTFMLTVERNGEMLISAERGVGVNNEMKEICQLCTTS